MPQSHTQLYDARGRRKYLNEYESQRFLEATTYLPLDKQLFCLVMFYTGCRPTEALKLTVDRIHSHNSTLVLVTLKRNRKKVTFTKLFRFLKKNKLLGRFIRFIEKHIAKKTEEKKNTAIYQRSVPVPPELIEALLKISSERSGLVWGFSRSTSWRIIKEAMETAGIQGIHACPRGLRHSFGIACVRDNVHIARIKKWMGHASIETTMIYLDVVEDDEQEFAQRRWSKYKIPL